MANYIRSPQSPGIGGLKELTNDELLFVQELAALTDPDGDRILFWDDSAGEYAFLEAGTGITISGTTITASAGAPAWGDITGTLADQTDLQTALDAKGDMASSTYDDAGIAEQLVGLTATQTLTHKDLSDATNTFPTFNQDTTGNAATATKLETARTIAGISFDGSADITIGIDNLSDVDTSTSAPTDGQVLSWNATDSLWEPATPSGTGDMLASTYDPNNVAADAFDMDNMVQGSTNKFVTAAELTVIGNTSGTNTGDQTITLTGDVTGSGTSSFATTVGKINGVALSGLSTGILKNTTTTGVPSIAVAADFPTLNQNTTGSAAKLTTARTILVNLASTSSASFDGSANVTPGIENTLPVGHGGTGATTLTGLIKGNGTSAFTAATSGTDYAPATSGTDILSGDGSGGFDAVTIGSGLSFSGGTLSASGGGGTGLTWVDQTTTSVTASVNHGYVADNASLVTVTLPSTSAVGDIVRVVGKGSGGWKIAQPSGTTVHFGNSDTTTGTSGYLSSNNQYDSVEMVCVTDDTDWVVASSIGNVTYN